MTKDTDSHCKVGTDTLFKIQSKMKGDAGIGMFRPHCEC